MVSFPVTPPGSLVVVTYQSPSGSVIVVAPSGSVVFVSGLWHRSIVLL